MSTYVVVSKQSKQTSVGADVSFQNVETTDRCCSCESSGDGIADLEHHIEQPVVLASVIL